MAVWMKVGVRGWPAKTQIKVELREGSETGPRLSGDVTLVIRKNYDRTSTRSLGTAGDLIVHVNNGRWDNSTAEWDYSYWANQGYNRIVAQYQGQESFWTPDRPQRQKDPPVPTKISKIHHTFVVDDRNKEIMRHVLVWTILDQFFKPIAGTVTSVFDGTNEAITSQPDRVGVCVDAVVVEGYGKELLYSVIPPTGQPDVLKLKGPDKPPADPTMASLTDLSITSRPHPTDKPKKLWSVFWTVIGSDGKAFANPVVPRLFGGRPLNITGDANGLCHEDDVEISGYDAKEIYTVFIPGLDKPSTRKSAELTGPEKKADETPKVYSIEADLDSPHPVGGRFIIAGKLIVDGKPADSEVLVSSSPEDVVVESRLGKVEPGAEPNTYKVTSSAGNFKFAVPATFASDNVELLLTALDGTSASVPMVKP